MTEPAPVAKPPSTFDKIMLFVGSLAYLGYVPVASGTVAVAVVGIPLYWLFAQCLALSTPAYLGATLGLTAIAIFVADHADRVLNEKDSKKNVIDELPGYLFALVAVPVTWQIITAAFFLERAIDIAKIWPANWIERRLPGGWGVVLDDVVAGLYTLIIIHLCIRFIPGVMGVTV
jgi:phosphatidylglycerophosphatase A